MLEEQGIREEASCFEVHQQGPVNTREWREVDWGLGERVWGVQVVLLRVVFDMRTDVRRGFCKGAQMKQSVL
jgi:hypothetical protein